MVEAVYLRNLISSLFQTYTVGNISELWSKLSCKQPFQSYYNVKFTGFFVILLVYLSERMRYSDWRALQRQEDNGKGGMFSMIFWQLKNKSNNRRKIRLIKGNAKCRHLKNWPVKGLWGWCLSVWGPELHIPLLPYTLYTCAQYTYSHREGGVELNQREG